MSEIDRRANAILKHFELYYDSPVFRAMVDNTVYIPAHEQIKSALAVDAAYGSERVDYAARIMNGWA